jgi:hypothetical protein
MNTVEFLNNFLEKKAKPNAKLKVDGVMLIELIGALKR